MFFCDTCQRFCPRRPEQTTNTSAVSSHTRVLPAYDRRIRRPHRRQRGIDSPSKDRRQPRCTHRNSHRPDSEGAGRAHAPSIDGLTRHSAAPRRRAPHAGTRQRLRSSSKRHHLCHSICQIFSRCAGGRARSSPASSRGRRSPKRFAIHRAAQHACVSVQASDV